MQRQRRPRDNSKGGAVIGRPAPSAAFDSKLRLPERAIDGFRDRDSLRPVIARYKPTMYSVAE
jgi:hypothetical protein